MLYKNSSKYAAIVIKRSFCAQCLAKLFDLVEFSGTEQHCMSAVANYIVYNIKHTLPQFFADLLSDLPILSLFQKERDVFSEA